jgi:hypoxanthine phosphoribosyltransferase
MQIKNAQTIQLGKHTFEKYITKEAIRTRVQEMGKEIATDYHDKFPIFVIVLNGAFVFAADLLRACSFECELEFVRLASYDGTQSTGQVKRILGLQSDIKDRHVIIVEDIVDTGRTIKAMTEDLMQSGPASVSVATLLLKPESLLYTFESPYVGFEIPEAFVLGYGLDVDGKARNLEDIYQLKT